MDLSQQVAYNGLVIVNFGAPTSGQSRSGYRIVSANISPVGVARYLEKRPIQDGMNASDVYESVRQVSLIVAVYGSSKSNFWDKHEALLAAFNPRLAYNADTANLGFLPFKYIRPTADTANWPNGIPLQIYLRPTAPPTYTVDVMATRDGGRGFSMDVNIHLEARDPRAYAQTSQQLVINSVYQTATHRGDYPTFPVLTFAISSAATSAFSVITTPIASPTSSSVITVDCSSFSTGTALTLDYSKGILVDANGVNQSGQMTRADSYPEVLPGSATKISTGNILTGISLPAMTYYEAWA